MIIGYRYYELTEQAKILGLQAVEDMQAYFNKLDRFAKKMGAISFVKNEDRGCEISITGLIFDKVPDTNVWRAKKTETVTHNGKTYNVYRPRKDTKNGKQMIERFSKLGKFTCYKLQKYLGWRDIIIDSQTLHWFGFSYNESGIYMFVPEVMNIKECYTPHKELKELTLSEFRSMVIDK